MVWRMQNLEQLVLTCRGSVNILHYLLLEFFICIGNIVEYLTGTINSLVQSTFEDLEDSGCIKISDDSVEPLMLGSIASQYYLKYTTVSMFGSNIGPDTSLEVGKH